MKTDADQVHPAAPGIDQDFRAGHALSTAAIGAHTPGPWFLKQDRTDPRKQVIYGAHHYRVGTADDHNGYAVNKANARLLVAAPELLEACRAIVAWDEAEKNARPYVEDNGAGWWHRVEMCQAAFDAAHAAIAKALGTPDGASGSPSRSEARPDEKNQTGDLS